MKAPFVFKSRKQEIKEVHDFELKSIHRNDHFVSTESSADIHENDQEKYIKIIVMVVKAAN